jgi:DHA2 family multidrug resistance protein
MDGSVVERGTDSVRADDWRPRFNPMLIGLVVSMATFMEVLDTSVANVALPHIAGNLAATTDESTWVLTSYLVSNAIILPMSGWFSALLGRKRFYMLCVGLFTISSLLCGLAPSLGVLIVCRILQGLGGGGLQPSVQAILVDTYPPAKRGMGMALYGVAVVTAPIIGPTLGGWITDNFTWRWIFLINIPVGILSLFLTSVMLEDPPYMIRKKLGSTFRIDYIGLGLMALGLGSLQLMLDKGEREDWFSSDLITTFAVIAVVSLVAAVFWELRTEHPIADLRLLKDRNFLLATITLFALGFVLYSSTVLLPLMLQTLMGYTAMLAGMALSPGGLMTMALMPLVGWLLSRVEARWLMVIGLTTGSLALFHMSGFNLAIDFHTAVWSRIYLSAGLAFLFVPLNTSAYHFIPKERVNNAAGIFNLARNIGGSVGIAVMITSLAQRTQFHQNSLVAHLTPFDEPFRRTIQGMLGYLAGYSPDPVANVTAAHQLIYGQVQRQAAMMAYVDQFWLAGLIFLAVIPLVLVMKKVRPAKERSTMVE